MVRLLSLVGPTPHAVRGAVFVPVAAPRGGGTASARFSSSSSPSSSALTHPSSSSSSSSSFLAAPSLHRLPRTRQSPSPRVAFRIGVQSLRRCSYKAMTSQDLQPGEEPKDVRKYLQQSHDRIFDNNKQWAEEMKKNNPEFFEKLSAGQEPNYLWIGCSDSRIPAEAITGLSAGEMFIHRNIANLVCATDLNVMSVINYAVRHLHVKHIVVCGHYGCGGVKAAMTPKDMGLLNPWLRNIRDVYRLHEADLDKFEGEAKYDALVEFNVLEQARNVIKTADVQQQYAKHGYPIVHGWAFGFKDGLLKDLEIDFEGQLKDIQKIYDLTNDTLEGS